MSRSTARKQVLLYFALVLGLSYLIWGPIAAFRIPTISFVSSTKGPLWAIIGFILVGFFPSTIALVLTGLWEGRQGLRQMGRRVIQFNIGGRWYLASVLLVVIATLGQIGISAIRGQSFDFSLFLKQLGSFLPLIILGPISEELGWRGYAQDRLERLISPILAAVMIGVVWAFWHLPLFFMVGTAQYENGLPFLPFLITLTTLSIVFAWLHQHTARSIWTAIFFHWIYTCAGQVVSSGIPQTTQNAWFSCIPYVVIAGLVMLVWKRGFEGEKVPANPALLG
jgi:membrane protease YdiL (CAAX protease family)